MKKILVTVVLVITLFAAQNANGQEKNEYVAKQTLLSEILDLNDTQNCNNELFATTTQSCCSISNAYFTGDGTNTIKVVVSRDSSNGTKQGKISCTKSSLKKYISTPDNLHYIITDGKKSCTVTVITCCGIGNSGITVSKDDFQVDD